MHQSSVHGSRMKPAGLHPGRVPSSRSIKPTTGSGTRTWKEYCASSHATVMASVAASSAAKAARERRPCERGPPKMGAQATSPAAAGGPTPSDEASRASEKATEPSGDECLQSGCQCRCTRNRNNHVRYASLLHIGFACSRYVQRTISTVMPREHACKRADMCMSACSSYCDRGGG